MGRDSCLCTAASEPVSIKNIPAASSSKASFSLRCSQIACLECCRTFARANVPVSAGGSAEKVTSTSFTISSSVDNGRCRRRCWWGTEYRLPDHMFLDAVPTKATCVLSHISGHFQGLFLARPLPQSPKPCNHSAATPRLGDNGDANTINGLN